MAHPSSIQRLLHTGTHLLHLDGIDVLRLSKTPVAAEDMLQAAYLTIGKLAPDYENVELSVGGSTVAAAVVEATGASHA